MFLMYLRLPGHPKPPEGDSEASNPTPCNRVANESQAIMRSAQIQRQKQIHQLRQLRANHHLERRLFG
ncbi:MAG TPA: hypothetical protein V6C57_23090 [Coleofasciculaceae cyanobacterium]